MTRFLGVGPNLDFSAAASRGARQKFMPSWAYWNGEGKFALAQGEVDITENLTAYAQVGAVKGTTQYLYSDIPVTNLNGNFTGSPRLNRQYRDQEAAQAGLRPQVDTGPIHHAINFNATGTQGEVGILNTTGTAFASNLYSPVQSPVPQLSVGPPPKISDLHMASYGIADTISVLERSHSVHRGRASAICREPLVQRGNRTADCQLR